MSENTIPETPAMPEFPETPNMPPSSPSSGDPSKNWMAIVSLVTAVLSLCGIFFAPIGCLFSVAAVVLGILGLKSGQKTLAIIGLIIGGIGVVISLIAGVIMLFYLNRPGLGNFFSDFITILEGGY